MNRNHISGMKEVCTYTYYNTFISRYLCSKHAFLNAALVSLVIIRLIMLQRKEYLGPITPPFEIPNQWICE